MSPQFRGYDLSGWLLGLGLVGFAVGYLVLSVVVAATFYVPEATLSTIGRPGTIGLLTVYGVPLIAIALFPERIHGFFLARMD